MNKKAILTVGLASAGIVGLALIGSGVIEIKKNVIEIKKNVIEIKKKPKKGTEVRCIHGFATINIEAEALELKVQPESVDVQKGCRLILRIVPPRKTMGDVTIKHEDSPVGAQSSWLNKTNTDSTDLILIDVPDDATEGIYKYSVAIPGFEKLDPYAEIIPD